MFLFTRRAIASITSVTEIVGADETVLAANDYALRYSDRAIERLTAGTNGRTCWADRVRVVYAPSADLSRRKRVLIDLVKLAVEYNAVRQESTGSHSRTMVDYQQEREAILSTLLTTVRLFA